MLDAHYIWGMPVGAGDRPLPAVQVHVEHDGPEGEARLQQYALSVLGLVTQQRHLGVVNLLQRSFLCLLNKLHLVRLKT